MIDLYSMLAQPRLTDRFFFYYDYFDSLHAMISNICAYHPHSKGFRRHHNAQIHVKRRQGVPRNAHFGRFNREQGRERNDTRKRTQHHGHLHGHALANVKRTIEFMFVGLLFRQITLM